MISAIKLQGMQKLKAYCPRYQTADAAGTGRTIEVLLCFTQPVMMVRKGKQGSGQRCPILVGVPTCRIETHVRQHLITCFFTLRAQFLKKKLPGWVQGFYALGSLLVKPAARTTVNNCCFRLQYRAGKCHLQGRESNRCHSNCSLSW